MIREELQPYIEEGRHGVTKHQMIPAINNNFTNTEVIKMLHDDYPNTFKSSLRYCKKAPRDACVSIFGEEIIKYSPEEIALINELKPSRKGISMSQVIKYVEQAVENGEYEKVAAVEKYFPEYYERSTRYIKKPILEKITAMKAVAGIAETVKVEA